MALSFYYRLCMMIPPLSRWGRRFAEGDPDIELVLEKANKNVRGEVFYTGLLMSSILIALGGLLIATLINLIFLGDWALPVKLVVWIALPILFAAISYGVYSYLPRNKISERKKNIERNLSYATNYMAAMASADVTPLTKARLTLAYKQMNPAALRRRIDDNLRHLWLLPE